MRSALADLGGALRRLGVGRTVTEALRDAVDAARALLDGDVAWIGRAAHNHPDRLVMVAHSGMRTVDMPATWRLELGEGIGGRVAATGQPMLIKDYRRDPRRVPLLKSVIDAEELRSGVVVAVPLDLPAVLYVGSRAPHDFDEDDLSLADGFASAVGAVVRGAEASRDVEQHRQLLDVALGLQQQLLGAETLDSVVAWLAHQVHGAASVTGADGKLLAAHVVEPASAESVELAADGAALGTLEIGGATLGPGDADVLAGMVALDLSRRREREATTLRLQADFLYGLINGDEGLGELRQRAALLGYDLSVPRRVVRVGIAGADVSRPVGLTPRVIRVLDAELRQIHGASPALPDRADAWLILPAERAEPDGVAALVDSVAALAPGLRLAAGVGRLCREPADYLRSRDDAGLALQIARARHRDVVHAEDLGAWRVLAPAASPDALRERAESVLGPLLDADREHRRDDLGTLRRWLANDRHLAKTAGALHVHVNTLRYRLRRIAALLDVDLRDPDERFPVEVAVRALELLDVTDVS